MPITPFQPTGIGGDSSAINVIRITFTQALSDIPKLTAYDDYNANTINHTIFMGTPNSGSKPLIAAVSKNQPSPNWFPTGNDENGYMSAGAANYLQGATDGIYLDLTAPVQNGYVYFNLAYKIPTDVTTSSTMGAAIVCEYQYTGTAPTLVFEGNTGTETSPIWNASGYNPLFAQTTGTLPSPGNTTQIRPCDAGKGDPSSGGDGSYRLTIPAVSSTYPEQIWLKNS